jgi:transcriptional regulator with XRE-family HTH domain
MHVRTFYRQRRGARTLAEASEATGISRGTLSRIERGEQFPKAGQFAAVGDFYCPEWLAIAMTVAKYRDPAAAVSLLLYPASVLRCLQLERNCVDCGKALPPESRANRKRHQGGCPA